MRKKVQVSALRKKRLKNPSHNVTPSLDTPLGGEWAVRSKNGTKSKVETHGCVN